MASMDPIKRRVSARKGDLSMGRALARQMDADYIRTNPARRAVTRVAVAPYQIKRNIPQLGIGIGNSQTRKINAAARKAVIMAGGRPSKFDAVYRNRGNIAIGVGGVAVGAYAVTKLNDRRKAQPKAIAPNPTARTAQDRSAAAKKAAQKRRRYKGRFA